MRAVYLLSAFTLFAADQRITIDAMPASFTVPATCGTPAGPCIDPVRAEIRSADAGTVLTALNGGPLTRGRSYIVHVLRYEDEKEPVFKDANHWYVYCAGCVQPWYESGPTPAAMFAGKRIFGSSDVALAYIHMGVRGATVAQVSAAITAKHPGADAAAAVVNLQNGRELELPNDAAIKASNGNRLRWLPNTAGGGGIFVEDVFLPVVYKMEITKKLPSNVQNLRDAISGSLQSAADDVLVNTSPMAIGLIQNTLIEHLPSDVSVTGFVGKGDKQKELGQNTYDNEGRHWWDASFLVPVNSVKQVQFDPSGSIAPKTVTKQNVFAAFNLYLPAANTKGTLFRWMPHLIYALPIQKRVLDRHLLGVGIGLNKVEAYAGVTFNRQEVPAVGGVAQPDRWIRKLSIGVNIPVKTAVTAFKGGKAKE